MFSSARDFLKVITPNTVRRFAVESRLALRTPTSSFRVLPNFLIIGAMRAGTSSLFKYLSSHPSIVGSIRKETWYFSIEKYFQKGESWYRTHFPTRQFLGVLEKLRGTKALSFEASANYLFHPLAAERIARLMPDSKLIVLLRNPVDRAFSHYCHNLRRGVEKRTFEDAIEQGLSLSGEEREQLRDHPLYDPSYRSVLYLCMGFYADQLNSWFRFFPRENFLILRSEDFFSRTAEMYQQVLEFIGVANWKPGVFRNYSYWGMEKEKQNRVSKATKISEQSRTTLKELYAPYNVRLAELLSRDFEWN